MISLPEAQGASPSLPLAAARSFQMGVPAALLYLMLTFNRSHLLTVHGLMAGSRKSPAFVLALLLSLSACLP